MAHRLETSFLGATTVQILHGVPRKQAGWLIKALVAWIVDGNEPDPATIPPECLGSWIAIREESVAIATIKKERAAAGKAGGSKQKQTESKTEANGKQTESKGNLDVDVDVDNISRRPLTRAPARTHAPADGEQRTAVDIPSKKSSAARAPSFSGDPDRWEVWARTVNDPVDAALSATGEGASKRPVYGKLLRDLGDKDLFREAVILFAAERRAGDPMRNPAAVLVKKLKQEIADERAAAARLAK